ncbi:MAG: hypothetical protein IJ072_02855, partial [Oscillospiraceae bacterium]|nr:hypothetical protein [Oscillospiraceae bacterium]
MKLLKRSLTVLLCLVMALGCLSVTASAEEGGSFCFTASTVAKMIIEPTRISYSPGQTIMEALTASGYDFLMDGFMIYEIEQVAGNYVICYDGGGYDLEADASSITALTISENEKASDELLELIKYMVYYTELDSNVHNYEPASTAYKNALSGLRSANSTTAQELLDALTAAVEEYDAIFNGPKYDVTFAPTQNGSTVSSPVITMTDAY